MTSFELTKSFYEPENSEDFLVQDPKKYTEIFGEDETDYEDEEGEIDMRNWYAENVRKPFVPFVLERKERIKKTNFVFEQRDLWVKSCREVKNLLKEFNETLVSLGHNPLDYEKENNYPFPESFIQEDPKKCFAKDFLDCFIFPTLLPAIMNLIEKVREKRIIGTPVSAFNGLDFIVEYLYNNNPLFPTRADKPSAFGEIPFVKTLWEKNPREPLPKRFTMSRTEAAIAIQSFHRGFLVRKRPMVQKFRTFWKSYKDYVLNLPSNQKFKSSPLFKKYIYTSPDEKQVEQDNSSIILCSCPLKVEECRICSGFVLLAKQFETVYCELKCKYKFNPKETQALLKTTETIENEEKKEESKKMSDEQLLK